MELSFADLCNSAVVKTNVSIESRLLLMQQKKRGGGGQFYKKEEKLKTFQHFI